MDSLLSNLPNGGAVLAIVVVVVFYLKHQERREDQVEAMIKVFTDEIASSRRDYLESLGRLVDRVLPGTKKP